MTLASSGEISIGGSTATRSINLELGRDPVLSANLNETPLRDLAGIPSGAISLSNFYGKHVLVQSFPVTNVNVGSGAITADSWTSTTYTSPANCDSVTPTVTLNSQNGDATGLWYYRSIRWRVEYYSGGSWVAGTWRIKDMGGQIGNVSDSGAFPFPSRGTWQWRLYVEFYNTSGSTWGTVGYTYSQETRGVASGSGYASINAATAYPSAATGTASVVLAAKTKSDEIYQITYSWNATVVGEGRSTAPSSYDGFVGYTSGHVTTTFPGTTFTIYGNASASTPSGYSKTVLSATHLRGTWSNKACSYTVSGSNLTYNASTISGALYYRAIPASPPQTLAVTISSAQAVIYYRAKVIHPKSNLITLVSYISSVWS